MSQPWIALMIGNSRLHWGGFEAEQLIVAWDTPHVSEQAVLDWVADVNRPSTLHQSWSVEALTWLASQPRSLMPLCLASVVPGQTQIWQSYPRQTHLKLKDIGLKNPYPTLGIDRALAVWGAGQKYGFPHLVVDAGTALTLSGVDSEARFVGGAILPGLRAQFQTLATQTAQLPWLHPPLNPELPFRWAQDTEAAIVSGIGYTLVAGMRDFIQDWRSRYPNSQITLTGGDGSWLYAALQEWLSSHPIGVQVDPNLVLWGIREVCSN